MKRKIVGGILGLLGMAGISEALQCSRDIKCQMQEYPCCSQYGWCGKTAEYCAPSRGCLSGCWPNDNGPAAVPTTKSIAKTTTPTKLPASTSAKTDPAAATTTTTASSAQNASTSTTAGVTTTSASSTAPTTGSASFYIPDATNETENPWYDARGVFASCPKKHTIALTFDDGPSEYTSALLAVLRKYQIKATFFVIGQNLAESGYADAIKLAAKEGHLIGSHTWSHKSLRDSSRSVINSEILLGENEIVKAIGRRPKYMRPPYGEYGSIALDILFRRGYKAIMWNLDTNDWQKYDADPEGIFQTFVDAFAATTNHSAKSWIPLMHDSYSQSVASVEKIILLGQKLGYSFVTINECFDDYEPYYSAA